ncbi:MAG: DUF4368 domain-containing protein, partial [Eubacteriales bacterium]
KLFEDNAEGKISERNYLTLSQKYEVEQAELEQKITALSEEMEQEDIASQNARTWVESIKDYADITELTAPLLNALIERITITEAEVIEGERVQTVNIFYKFVGSLSDLS